MTLTTAEAMLSESLARAVDGVFDEVLAAVLRAIPTLLDEVEQNIHAMAELDQINQADHDRVLVRLQEATAAVKKHRQVLEYAIKKVSQE